MRKKIDEAYKYDYTAYKSYVPSDANTVKTVG
jgi:hypothetical protein